MPTDLSNPQSSREAFAPLIKKLGERGENVTELPKQSRQREEAEVMKLRRRGLCEFPGCKRLATDNHHTQTRGSGGGDEESNTGRTCRQCHIGIHSDPRMRAAWDATMARRNGLKNWLVRGVVQGLGELVRVQVIVPAATDIYAKDMALDAITGSQLGRGDNRTVTIESAEQTDKALCAVEVT